MNMKKIKHAHARKPIVLIVDDQYRVFQSLPRLIDSDAYHSLWVPGEQEGMKALEEHAGDIQIIIIDLKSSGIGGGGFLHQARQIVPKAAIMITGPLGPFLYQGGHFWDFHQSVLKDDINSVLKGISQKMATAEPSGEQDDDRLANRDRLGVIIGKSPAINKIYRLIDNLKHVSSTVLIQGESGTGKELIAKTIHQTSLRRSHPFVAINCGAIPANLMESELFGHERGAFTSAVNKRRGKFEIACGGTLFLDEVSELEKELQVKLLRVLQEKEFQRVGGNTTHKTDVRIVAATSRNMKEAVQAGHFRDDLYYRLNVLPVHVPPLRDRRGDIPLLLAHFFETTAKEMCQFPPRLSDEALNALKLYSYPGNVRELANIVERMIITCPNGVVACDDLPHEVRAETAPSAGARSLLGKLPAGGVRMCDMEKELILKTLEMTSENKTDAARLLGITRRRLYLRLAEYEAAHHQPVTSGDRKVAVCNRR